jgi:hypothetical protein
MIILYFYAFLNNQQPRQGVLLNIFQLDKPEQKKPGPQQNPRSK